jgi:hypothetical protein
MSKTLWRNILIGLIFFIIVGSLIYGIYRAFTPSSKIFISLPEKQEETYLKKETIFIPWGSGEDEIGLWKIEKGKKGIGFDEKGVPLEYEIEPPPPQGPLTFAVDKNGNIYIMDNINEAVKKFNPKGNFIGTVVSGVSGRAIAIDSNENIYLLGDYKILHYSRDGKLVDTFEISKDIELYLGYGQGIFFDKKGNLFVNKLQEYYPIAHFIKTERDLSILKPVSLKEQSERKIKGVSGISDNYFAIKGLDKHTKAIQILNAKGSILKEIIMKTSDYFGSTLFLKQDKKGTIYIETNRITPDNYVHLEVRKYDPETDQLIAIIELPNEYYTEVNKTIEVDELGNIYHFQTTEGGVVITKWEPGISKK